MDLMMNVPGTLWHNLGRTFTDEYSSEAIIKSSELDYEVSAHTMYDDIHSIIKGYHSYYRDDTRQLLGVVNTYNPQVIQNVDSFLPLEDLIINGSLKVDTVNELSGGRAIVGVFKTNSQYKILDDDTEHYIVAINDHLKPDGKILLLHTPVRLACMNAMNDAIAKACYSMRVPVINDTSVIKSVGNEIMRSVESAAISAHQFANRYIEKEMPEEKVEELLDIVLPFVRDETGTVLQNKANESVAIQRDTFKSCMQVDNLANYDNTAYQVYQAAIDYTQHYFKSAEKGYDFNTKMKILPKVGEGSEIGAFVTKTLKFLKAA